MTPREAAYLALLTSLRNEGFVAPFLEQWQRKEAPALQDLALAREIASGSARMALALDYIAAQLTTMKKLTLKLKERALLRTAIYQCCFMKKMPLYAVANETVELAKKYCHVRFAHFLNALLRKLADGHPMLPTGNSPEELSIRYSYPISFITGLLREYAMEKTLAILNAGNIPSKAMVRVRPGVNKQDRLFEYLLPFPVGDVPVYELESAAVISDLSLSPGCYIQNVTPAALVAELAAKSVPPHKVLDLCASPGGKLLAAHDWFPKAAYFANDISEDKLSRLSQNLEKYGVVAELSCGFGENFSSPELFDLVILDVPCSNSGVLNKRPEARWRLMPEALEELKKKQSRLLAHAATLLAPGGVIWYLTCSILKEENEYLTSAVCSTHPLKICYEKTVLPTADGWDGGFACLLQRSDDRSAM